MVLYMMWEEAWEHSHAPQTSTQSTQNILSPEKSSSLVELVIGHSVLHCRRPWARLLLPRRHELTRIKAPSILYLPIVLVWVEDWRCGALQY